MKQALGLDCLAFDSFPFERDGLSAPVINVGRREVIRLVDQLITRMLRHEEDS